MQVLSRFDGKTIKVTTEDGHVFVGTAEAYPSGYGLHEFGVEEESVEIEDTHIFLSEIAKIDVLSEPESPEIPREHYIAFVKRLLDTPVWTIDMLPEQVPEDAKGQYFMVNRYFRQQAQLARIYRKHAEILLRLNCFHDMAVSFDGGELWEKNPEPDGFVEKLSNLSPHSFLRALFIEQDMMVDIEFGYTAMAIYCLKPAMLEKLQKMAIAEGFFFLKPDEA